MEKNNITDYIYDTENGFYSILRRVYEDSFKRINERLGFEISNDDLTLLFEYCCNEVPAVIYMDMIDDDFKEVMKHINISRAICGTELFNEADQLKLTSEMKKILKEGVFPSDIKKYLAYDDSKVVSRLKFLCDTGFDLVYDSDYNADVRKAIDNKLGDCLVIDTPRRDILQKIGSGENKLLVHGSQSNQVLSALDISPVLKSLQGVSIHKLRYYAPHESADKIRKEIQKIAKEATK